MHNALRGRTEFSVAGKRYEVAFNWNSAVEFEEVAGKPLSEAVADLLAGRLSAKVLRALLWSGLREGHPELGLRDIGALLDLMGRREAQRVIGVGVRYFYPELTEQAADAAADGAADPPTALPST